MPRKLPQWAISYKSKIIALKLAPDQESALHLYPTGATAEPWDGTHPEHLCPCVHCGSGRTSRWDKQFRYCPDCRVTYSLSVWRDRPEIEHPHPSLTREEKIAYYSAQNVPQKKIGEYLSISSSRVSQLYQEYKCTKS